MKSIRALLADRRRAQRGSVLSAVLILVAFLAIISGALTTELSTNFLLSHNIVNRVSTEATVNSAMELALGSLQDTQTTPLYAGCPSPRTVTLNGQTAAVGYTRCAPVIDARSPQTFTTIATSTHPFQVDGSHPVLSALGVDEYLTGDSGGTVYAFATGQSAPSWSFGLGGQVTGPPVAMLDQSNSPADISNLVPVTNPSNTSVNPGCGTASACVALLAEDAGPPSLTCFMAAGGPVTSAPAAGSKFPDVAYFGDTAGTVFAYDATAGAQCELEDSQGIPGGGAVVAGPIVFPGPGRTDEIYMVVSNGGSSTLVNYSVTGRRSAPHLNYIGSLALPATATASGMALEKNTLPARLAITFSNGQVSLVQIQAGFGMALLATSSVPAGIGDAPFWCHCPGGLDLIGIGAANGALYVLDTNLNVYASYQGSSAISTTPGADAGGDWFFAADNGSFYELQKPAGSSTMVLAAQYGSAGAITSAPVVASCPGGICIYFGSSDANLYLLELDARNAVLTSCISTSPPACSSVNPRLWAHVEVGVAGNSKTVHVQGWSYYSP